METCLGKVNKTLSQKQNTNKKTGDMIQVTVPPEALGLILSTEREERRYNPVNVHSLVMPFDRSLVH
jgi:hypothetical protein